MRQVKIYSTNDPEKKEKFQEVLCQNNIKYKVKAKDVFKINIFDTAVLGSLGNNQIKITYYFYVAEEEQDYVMSLICAENL